MTQAGLKIAILYDTWDDDAEEPTTLVAEAPPPRRARKRKASRRARRPKLDQTRNCLIRLLPEGWRILTRVLVVSTAWTYACTIAPFDVGLMLIWAERGSLR